MAVLMTYPLDLTASLTSNKITGEVRTIVKDADRVFIPTGGPFYTKSLKIFAGTTLLQPVKDYVALELNRDGTLTSGKEVCNVLLLKNVNTSFKLDYQVIGGEYSDYSNELADLINATPISKLNILTWGSILGKPTTYPPTAHSHYPFEWRGYTQVIHLLEQLRQLIVAGDQSQIAALYQYIENNIKDIAMDYIDKNGLLFIDKTPTSNGNVLLDGKGTASEPLKINIEDLLKELDIRYFQNSINPLSRIGAISDNFLPISAGFFNAHVPLSKTVSLSVVGNVERNGDLLLLTPATNGEVIRYVYGYVRGWSNDANISRYRPTNQQYRPPGLAPNEEIMDLFGYNEQSMIGAIYVRSETGVVTFKEHCVIWLNGTLAAESHVLERLGLELASTLVGTFAELYLRSPMIVKLRRGEKFLVSYTQASTVDVFRMDDTTKKFTRTRNWRGILQKNTVEPLADQTIHNITDTTETTLVTGQDYCRPFHWYERNAANTNEYFIFDENKRHTNPAISHDINTNTGRQRMGCRVVGDTIKTMAVVSFQTWIKDTAYRGGSIEHLGFTLEIMPLETIPTYKWIRHSREGASLSTGRSSSSLTTEDRGYLDVYESNSWTLIPMDLFSYWHWWENLQPSTLLQLNDGRLLNWNHPADSGYPINFQSPRYSQQGDWDVEKMYVNYHNVRFYRQAPFGNSSFNTATESQINFPAPTVNKVNSTAAVLADGTVILREGYVNPRTVGWTNQEYTAYRPSSNVVDYKTATNGVLQGFDTTNERIRLVGDYDGKYDTIPWVSARRADGSTKVGALWWYRPINGQWVDQSAPANIRIDWAAKQLIREEMYTMTQQGFNAIEDYLRTKLAILDVTILHTTWSVVASPLDPSTGLLIAYCGWSNRALKEFVIPVKFQWDANRRLTGININKTELYFNVWTLIPGAVLDPRFGWSRLQWVVDYNQGMTKAFWAGKMPNASNHGGDTMSRAQIYTYLEEKSGATSTWQFLTREGNESTTSGYKGLVATAQGVGLMTDTVGFGVFRALQKFKSHSWVTGSIYSTDKPFIYVTPRPPSDFSLNVTDLIDVQLGGVYGQVEPQTYSLTDPAVSDVVNPRSKTLYIYMVIELGNPRINFREVPMAESIYATYLGKCTTDEYGVMELDIQPVTRIGNYRPSATPRGSSFSVSSGTPDTERLLNWDANVFSSGGIGEKSTMPEGAVSTPGVYEYILAPGDVYFVEMLGGAGGGGASGYTVENLSNSSGKAGTATTLSVNGEIVFEASPGFGGTGGYWGNGSYMSPGNGGPGGVGILYPADFDISISQLNPKPGSIGNNSIWNHWGGGVFKSLGGGMAGVGGAGGNGVGDNGNSNGGGGGGAGYMSAKLRNSTNETVTIGIVIGSGGLPGTAASSGQKGNDGIAVFTKLG